jgi:hypothetical protein
VRRCRRRRRARPAPWFCAAVRRYALERRSGGGSTANPHPQIARPQPEARPPGTHNQHDTHKRTPLPLPLPAPAADGAHKHHCNACFSSRARGQAQGRGGGFCWGPRVEASVSSAARSNQGGPGDRGPRRGGRRRWGPAWRQRCVHSRWGGSGGLRGPRTHCPLAAHSRAAHRAHTARTGCRRRPPRAGGPQAPRRGGHGHSHIRPRPPHRPARPRACVSDRERTVRRRRGHRARAGQRQWRC